MKSTRVTLQRGGMLAAVAALGLSLLVRGCVSPGSIDPSVINRYQEAMARKGPQVRQDTGRLQEFLPAEGANGPELEIVDEGGGPVLYLSLQEAIMRGLANNLDIRVLSYAPEISREQVMQAAAEFDYVLFGGVTISETDDFFAITGGHDDRRGWDIQIGVRQHTVTGADWSLTLDQAWDRNKTGATTTRWEPTLSLAVSQPLLRGGWAERNLAALRIARLTRDTSSSAFRQQAEQTITDIITAYWLLVQSRRDVEIQERLLEVSITTLERIQNRMKLDATAVQIRQTEAAVEQRRAALINFEKLARDAQDNLGRLLADATFNSLTDAEVIPTDVPTEVEVLINETDQLVTALRFSPLLEQARLAIATADINVMVAENDKLPQLDLAAAGTLAGSDPSLGDASRDLASLDQISWSLGLSFEYPLGNREREAVHRQRRYERLQAITELQNTTDQVAVVVRERIRAVRTAYREIAIQQAAVTASEAQLQALDDTERIRGALTPEFLQVKLSAQDSLALAHRSLIQAIVAYNVAMIEVNRATGTVLETHRVQLAMPIADGQTTWTATE